MLRPTMLSESMVARALGDPKFLAQVPEMSSLKNRPRELSTKPVGCRNCVQNQVIITILREFVRTILAMGEEARTRLKRYFGVEALMLNIHNTSTNQVEVKII